MKNQVKVLYDQQVPVYSHKGKEKLLHEFYSSLLGTTSDITWHFSLEDLYPDSHDFSHLDEQISAEEIKLALWTMKSSSSPGPDGFGPGFYKKFWDLTKQDLL